MKSNFKIKISRVILSIIILSGLVSCEQEIVSEIPKSNKLICLNGIFSPDSILKLNLTQTTGINEKDSLIYIKNADVEVLENNNFFCSLQYITNGNYETGEIKPKQGNSYKVIVSIDGQVKVFSTVFIEKRPEITSIDTIKEIFIDIQEKYWLFKLGLKDSENYSNYYFVNVYVVENKYNNKALNDTVEVPILLSNQFDDTGGALKGGILNDNQFDGKTIGVEFAISDTYLKGKNEVIICISAVSEDYYKHILSYCRYEVNKKNWGDFSGSVSVFSNIDGGTGILGSQSTSEKIIVLTTK